MKHTLHQFVNIQPLSFFCAALGFDGGQRQWFVMEIFDQNSGALQANVSARYPVFTISGLDAGRFLRIAIFAVNGKGASDAVILETFTLKVAEKQTGTHSQFEITPILTVGIFIGVLTAISCIALGTIVAIKLRTMRRRRHQGHVQADGQAGKNYSTRPGNLPIKEKISMPLGSGELDELYDDKNPDVVPCNEGKSAQLSFFSFFLVEVLKICAFFRSNRNESLIFLFFLTHFSSYSRSRLQIEIGCSDACTITQ